MTGGYTGVAYGFLDSTELLRDGENQWTYSGQLPSYRYALKGATVNNKVIVTGTIPTGYDSEAGQWIELGRLQTARRDH